jgi:hypothetical protein
MHTNYLVVHYFPRKLCFWMTIVPCSPICMWHVLKMVATVHEALRYGEVVCVIAYHPNLPNYVAHHIFMINVEDAVRDALLLIDAEVMKFHQCIDKRNDFCD